MFAEIREAIAAGLAGMGAHDPAFEVRAFEGDAQHGDIATSAALAAARGLGRAPRDIGEELAGVLAADARFEWARVAGPGFVNMRLADAYLEGCLERIAAAPRGEASGLGGVFSVLVEECSGARVTWTAQSAVSLARACGVEAQVVAPEAAQVDLSAWVGPEGAFGDVTAQEQGALARELGRVVAAPQGPLAYFAQRAGGFRPGFLEAASGRADILAVSVEPIDLPEGLTDEELEQARIWALTHRSDKRLSPSRADLCAPIADNPAFWLHYTAASIGRSAGGSGPLWQTAEERSHILRLGEYGMALALAHRLGAPHRLGIYLLELARDWRDLRLSAQKRGEKALSQRLIDATAIVFFDGLDILDVTARDEIT